MSFKRGTQYKVFITTENTVGAILCTGSVAEASASTVSSGIGPNDTISGVGVLGCVTASTDSGSEFRNLEAIEPEWSWEDDAFTVFGQTRPLDNPIRKKWSVTLTKKGENKLLSKLADGARFGVTGSTPALFDGLDTMPDSTGYRVYVYDGTDFAVGFHGTVTGDGYSETLGPDAVTVQSITIAGGLWSASIEEDASGLSDSMDITQ